MSVRFAVIFTASAVGNTMYLCAQKQQKILNLGETTLTKIWYNRMCTWKDKSTHSVRIINALIHIAH